MPDPTTDTLREALENLVDALLAIDVSGEIGDMEVWVLTDGERRRVADGYNICLTVVGTGTPPVQMQVTPEQPGKADEGGRDDG